MYNKYVQGNFRYLWKKCQCKDNLRWFTYIYLLNMMLFHSELFNYQKVHISVPSSLGQSSNLGVVSGERCKIVDLMEQTYTKNMVFHCFPVNTTAWLEVTDSWFFLGQSHQISPHISWMILNMPSAPMFALRDDTLQGAKWRKRRSLMRSPCTKADGWRAAAQLRPKILGKL